MRKGTKTIIVSVLIAGSLLTGYVYRDKDMHIVQETVNRTAKKISDVFTTLAAVPEGALENFWEPASAKKTNQDREETASAAVTAEAEPGIKEKFVQLAECIGSAQSREEAAK